MTGTGSVYVLTVDRPGRQPLRRWVAAYSVGPRGGAKKHVRYLRQAAALRLSRGRTAAQAERACRRATERLLEGLIEDVLSGRQGRRRAVDAPGTTLGAFLRRWHETYVTTVGAKQAANTTALLRHVEPALGDVPLAGLRPSDVEAFLAGLRRRLSGQTVRHAYNLLAVALDAALRDELVERNVVRLTRPPAVVKVPRRPWTMAECAAFLETARSDRYYPAYLLAIIPGLRQGEILGLAWSDVELDELRISVDLQLARRGGDYVRVPTKSRRGGTRSIEDALARALREHRAQQLAERLAAGRPTDDGLVFVTERGRPVSGSWLTHHFEMLSARAGVPVIPFHGLRHAAASYMAAAGVSPAVAQLQLGHANVATTLGVYTHVSEEQTLDAARRIAAALGLAASG